MRRIGWILSLIMLCMVMTVHGQDVSIEDIMEDIFNQLSEEDEIVQEDVQEQLMNIAANPIDLNHTNASHFSDKSTKNCANILTNAKKFCVYTNF